MGGDDLDYFRSDVGVPDLVLDVLVEAALALDDLVVVQQHLAPEVLLAVAHAVIIEVLLSSRQLLAHQPPPQLPQTPEAL